MLKRILTTFLCVCLLFAAMPVEAIAGTDETKSEETKSNLVKPGNISGYTTGTRKTINDIVEQYKFNKGTSGHGFAAERGNNLIDTFKGMNATIVGDDNVANGADRKILNRNGTATLIQDKYYSSASKSIEACFKNGSFRYIDGDGKPMQIEVPSNQYDEAIKLMAQKIENGAVPGVTDPADAEYLVRKGSLSYKQAVNLARAGTVESLAYDAANGVISASCAFGISALINYSILRLNGLERKDAIKDSAIEGVKTGGAVFATEVIVGQLSKAGVTDAFVPSTKALVKAFGEDFANTIVAVYAPGGVVVGDSAINYAAKVLSTQMIAAGVTVIVLSINDIYNIFTGRISAEQLIKNLAVTTAGVAGGYIGWYAGAALGTVVAPGVGTVVGGVGGSAAIGFLAGVGTEKALSLIIKDDAEEMVEIIQADFQQIAEEYMLSEDEAEVVTEKLSEQMTGKALKDMFASEDRDAYAKQMIEPLVEEQILARDTIDTPSEEEMRTELATSLNGVVFVH